MSRLPFGEYARLPGVNFSSVKHLAKSPAYYLWTLTESPPDTGARKRGRATHCAVYEPERFATAYDVWAGRRAGKAWDDYLAAATRAGKEVLTEKEYELVKALAVAVRGNPIAARYVTGIEAEQTFRGVVERSPAGDIPGWRFDVKGRVDAIRSGAFISDLKTTRDASPAGFGREVLRLDLHAQAAWYVDLVEYATGEELPFFWVAAEATAPHLVQVYRCPENVLALGRERYMQWLDTLALCQRTNHWPGYAEAEMDVVLPRWAAPVEDEDFDALDLEIAP